MTHHRCIAAALLAATTACNDLPGVAKEAQVDQEVPFPTVCDGCAFPLETTGTTDRAQTFTVGVDGVLTRVDVHLTLDNAGDIAYDVRTTSGGIPNESNTIVLHADTFPGATQTGARYYLLSMGPEGVPVQAGQVLAIALRSTTAFQWNGRNDGAYDGGRAYVRQKTGVWSMLLGDPDLLVRTWVIPQ